MRVVFGDNDKIGKEENFSRKTHNIIFPLLLIAQLLFDYLGNAVNSFFFSLEIFPILILLYMLYKKLKKGILDIFIVIFTILISSIFILRII